MDRADPEEIILVPLKRKHIEDIIGGLCCHESDRSTGNSNGEWDIQYEALEILRKAEQGKSNGQG